MIKSISSGIYNPTANNRMQETIVLLEKEKETLQLLRDFVNGKISRDVFNEKYENLLPLLEQELDSDLYHPLDMIVPSRDNSERAWKENMREMYMSEIEKLDRLLENNEPTYSEQLTKQQQREFCEQAIQAISLNALDRESKLWIEDNIVENEQFAFFKADGNSKFGNHESLYKSKIVNESFLISALSGQLERMDFEYSELISLLKENNKEFSTVWIRCSEPDGLILIENSPYCSEAKDETENLKWIDYMDPQSTQWGVCHLVFMSADKTWMLVHTNTYEDFEIQLHGSKSFVSDILKKLQK